MTLSTIQLIFSIPGSLSGHGAFQPLQGLGTYVASPLSHVDRYASSTRLYASRDRTLQRLGGGCPGEGRSCFVPGLSFCFIQFQICKLLAVSCLGQVISNRYVIILKNRMQRTKLKNYISKNKKIRALILFCFFQIYLVFFYRISLEDGIQIWRKQIQTQPPT